MSAPKTPIERARIDALSLEGLIEEARENLDAAVAAFAYVDGAIESDAIDRDEVRRTFNEHASLILGALVCARKEIESLKGNLGVDDPTTAEGAVLS